MRAPASDLQGTALLDSIVTVGSTDRSWAIEAVRDYFQGARFSGRAFERLGASHLDHFEPVDLVAVSMLGVDVSGEPALTILLSEGDRLSTLLANIPTTPIYEAGWDAL